ncbi:integral membrane protein [Fusarium austroafricanum]|uniref:Integral membrane protein n=1 Tax=Fusarium austroafricanum TaxID=2364996 RepID=A0A8H4KGT1_9HYPO|nr:integral membrane protein [Fusarium austroafricanum]
MAVRDTLGPVMAAFIGIDVAVVLARLGIRVKLTTLGYDDYVIVVGLIGFIVMCSFCFVSLAYGFGITDPSAVANFENYNGMEAARYFTFAQITYVASFGVVRISVALVLHRIVQGWPRTQLLLVISMVFVGVYALGCILVDVLQCIPLKAVWGDGTGKCLSSSQLAGLGFAVSALDIASALFYAVLPVFLLKGLQMGRRTKTAIIILLGLGAGTVIISIIRLKSLVQIVHSKNIAAALDLQLESFI